MSDVHDQLQSATDGLRAVGAIPNDAELRVIDLTEVREQDLNARSMPPQMMEALTQNIEAAGGLESFPLCSQDNDGPVEIISGHHRIRAARAAGRSHTVALVYRNLSRDQLKAKQLAHNSISGKDDPELVKRIFADIQDVSSRIESFIDPKTFDNLPDPVSYTQPDLDVFQQSRYLTLLFLPLQLKDFHDGLAKLAVTPKVEQVVIANRDSYEPWVEGFHRIRDGLDVSFVGAALAEMARLAVERLEQLQLEDPDTYGHPNDNPEPDVGEV